MFFTVAQCVEMSSKGKNVYGDFHFKKEKRNVNKGVIYIGNETKLEVAENADSNIIGVLNLIIFFFISVINQLDSQKFCLTISLFHASTCFEHMCSLSGGQNCITQPLVSSH